MLTIFQVNYINLFDSFFKGTIDVYIVFSRIQVLYPKLKFLAKASIYKIALTITVFSVFLNIPINMGRQVTKVPFKIESNETTILETIGKKFNP